MGYNIIVLEILYSSGEYLKFIVMFEILFFFIYYLNVGKQEKKQFLLYLGENV